VEDMKERKIMRLLLKINNGTPSVGKTALRHYGASVGAQKMRHAHVPFRRKGGGVRTWAGVQRGAAMSVMVGVVPGQSVQLQST
jgi:hypothetical protein